MSVFGGPAAAFALLLALAGAAKVARPADTVGALRGLHLPASAMAVRLLALSEVAIAAAVLVSGNRLSALLMALSYLGFAGFVALAMARGAAISSCGCFGTPDTPPTVAHLLVSLAGAGVAALTIAYPVHPILAGIGNQPLMGLPFIVLTGCCTWLAYAALTLLPKMAALTEKRSS